MVETARRAGYGRLLTELRIRPLARLLDIDPDRLRDELYAPRFPRRTKDPENPTYALRNGAGGPTAG